MSKTIVLRTLLPVTVSVLVHAGAVTAIALGPGWLPDRTPWLVAELVEAEAPSLPPPPPKPVVRTPPPLTPPRPIVPPKPIATPLPPEPPPARPAPEPVKPAVPAPPPAAVPEPPRALPEPPAAVNPEPDPPKAVVRAPAPGPTVPRGSLAGSVASVPDAGPGELAPRAGDAALRVTPSASPSRGLDVAALPPDGVTRQALPRGGYQYRPSYPARARALGIQGTTLLHVHVSDRGQVAEVVVKQSAGHPDLDQAAVDAVRRWRFEPARRGDDAVAMWVQLPFEFRLR